MMIKKPVIMQFESVLAVLGRVKVFSVFTKNPFDQNIVLESSASTFMLLEINSFLKCLTE